MKTMDCKQAAQGDLLLMRIEDIPAGADRVKASDSKLIAAHSETGHHHWLAGEHCKMYRASEMLSYLDVTGPYVDLVHARNHDTHETIRLPKGKYALRRQREYTPEGWRRVED